MIDEKEEVLVSEPEEKAGPEISEAAPSPETDAEPEKSEGTDYEELVKADMNELTEEFSNGEKIKITDLKNPIRYGALRDLGLTPREAYLASGGKKERVDNRSHLSSSVPRKLSAPFSEMPRADLDAARELFSDMNDSEIRNLYKKVTQ